MVSLSAALGGVLWRVVCSKVVSVEGHTMSRRHFKALAKHISFISDLSVRTKAAYAVAEACRQFNPRFKLQLFLLACLVEG